MASVTITANEILDAIRAASQQPVGPDDAHTRKEIQRALGWGDDRTLRVLSDLQRAGRLEVVHVTRPNLVGVVVKVPAYRFLPAKKGKR